MRDSILKIAILLLLVSVNVAAGEIASEMDNPLHSILVQDGKLSLRVNDILLSQLIDEIGYQAGFTIISYVELDQRAEIKEYH